VALFKIKSGKSVIETDVESVEIGTHSSCALYLKDPIASRHHARISHGASGFVIEDQETATGTWRNGEELRGAAILGANDVIVVGCTRITVSACGATLELEVDSKPFFFEPSSSHKDESGKLVVGGDAERLVRDEVLFSRFGALSLVNKIAAAAGLLFLLALCMPSGRGVVLQPGPLASAHARLFETEPTADTPAWLAKHHETASREGCSACHDTFGGAPAERCANCHDTLLAQNHPFYCDPSSLRAAMGITLDADVCASCHLDHSGAKPADGTFLPDPKQLAASCVRCHEDGPPATENVVRKPARFEPVEHDLVYDRFPHDEHKEHACEICHVRDTTEAALAVGRDFAKVEFRRCMDCHSADDAPTANNAWGRDPTLAAFADKVEPKHRVALAWHGSGARSSLEFGTDESGCVACHTSVHAAELRSSKVNEHESLSFTLQRRAHGDVFGQGAKVADAKGAQRGCVECHPSGSPLHAGEKIDGRFWHEVHMSSVRPSGTPASDALSDVCAQCHAELATSTHLAGTDADAQSYVGPSLTSCAECHHEMRNGSRDALVLAAKPSEMKTERMRTDFPHAPHVRAMNGDPNGPLADGCFACHTFEAGERAFQAEPKTLSDAANCIACHYDHEHVGGPSATGCALCHPDDANGADPLWFGKKAKRMRADTPGFSHWSRGHAQDTDSSACATCHGGVENARTVAEVPIPSEADSACFACHVRARFHWRGAPATAVSSPR